MQPSEHLELASPISSPVKWKVRKVSAIRDFPKSFKCSQIHITNSSTNESIDSIDEMMVKYDISPDHNIGSQEKVVNVKKAVLKPDELEKEEVKNDHSPNQDIGSQEKIVVDVEKAVLKPYELENEKVDTRVDSNLVEPVRLDGSDDAAAGGCTKNMHLRIGINPPPKRRNVPVVRDYPLGLKKFSEQINQSENDIDDDIQSMESLMNDDDDVHDSDGSLVNDEDDVHESDEGLMNDEDDVHESEEGLMNDEDDVHESEEGLRNDQDDVHEFEESLMMYGQDDVHESKECLMNDEDETVKEDGTDLTGYKSLSKLNIPRRRVSAVRCFPPGCGRNAVRLSDEELKKALAESKNYHCLSCSGPELENPFMDEEIEQEEDEEEETEMVEENFGKKEKRMEEKVEGRRDIVIALRASRFSSTENSRAKTTAKRKFEEEEENVEKEEKEMMEETEALKTDGKEEMMKAKLQGERMVVIALRASRCSSIQNASSKSTAKINPIKKEKNSKFDSKQGERRIVVQGLMASSQCIWRNNPRKKVCK